MDDYVIGAGAILTAGSAASISSATLHAKTEPRLASQIAAAVFDFESSHPDDLYRIVAMAAGWNAARFAREFSSPLLQRRECRLADVLIDLGQAVGTSEVHLFARWLPDRSVLDLAGAAGIRIVCHPIESIAAASLISGQTVRRWEARLRAA